MKKSVLILSGGLDSVTLLHYIAKYRKEEVYPVAFIYGQKHSIEIKMAQHQADLLKTNNVHELKIIDISFMKDLLKGSSALIDDTIAVPTLKDVIGEPQPITYVPYRNMLFLTMALSYAEAVGAENVYYGAQKHDEYSGYWDTTMYFVDAMNRVSSLNRLHDIQIKAPFVNLSKAEEIVIGQHLNIDYKKTWTSYKVVDEANEIADAENPTSCDRIKAFATVGIKDPCSYDKAIGWDTLFDTSIEDYSVVVNNDESIHSGNILATAVLTAGRTLV